MRKKMKWNFVRIVMLIVFVVFFVLIFAINIFNIINYEKRSDFLISNVIENHGKFPTPHMNKNMSFDFPNRNMRDVPLSRQYCIVTLDENKEILQISMDNIIGIQEEDVSKYAASIIESGKTEGEKSNFKYKLLNSEKGYLLVMLDVVSEKSMVSNVLAITCIIGTATYGIVFLFVMLISNRAVTPIVESYEKQKQFLTDASHELKTPLTVISANTEILSMEYGKNEWCEGIGKQSKKMMNLISQMITLCKMDENRDTEITEKFNLSIAVYDTVKAFENVALHTNKKMNVDIEPNITYKGNEAELRQCIAILTDNAVKYCDSEGIIKISLKKERKIEFTIYNSYAQVDSLEHQKLFHRFYRADLSRNAENSFGLGLSIARTIIQKHNGIIKAKPVKDSGINFHIIL